MGRPRQRGGVRVEAEQLVISGDALSAMIGALVALVLQPLTEFIYKRISETRAYYAHTADRIRDFRESVAVLESILIGYDDNRKLHPVDTHISKVQIPESITTVNAVDLFSLSDSRHADALHVSNILFNISRDAESILASKRLGSDGYEAFMRQCWELADKLRNLATKFEDDFPPSARLFAKKGTTARKKQILWEDGSKSIGVAFSARRNRKVNKIGSQWRAATRP